MAVRSFDGTDDEIRFPVPASGGANLTGALTVAAVVKRGATGAWNAIAAGHNSAGAYQWEFAFAGAGADVNKPCFFDAANGSVWSTAITSTTTWYLIAFTKPTGSSLGRWHVYDFTAATWTHTPGVGYLGGPNVANPATQASGHLSLGEAADVDDFNGRLAVYGAWTAELTDAQCQALATGFATSAWVSHAVAPAGVWDLNQATNTADVPDLTANAQTATSTITSTTDNSGIQGTSVVTGDDPPGWTFGAGGAGAPASLPPTRSRVLRSHSAVASGANFAR